MSILTEQDHANFQYLLQGSFRAVAQGTLSAANARSSIMRAIAAVDDGNIQEVRRVLQQETEATRRD